MENFINRGTSDSELLCNRRSTHPLGLHRQDFLPINRTFTAKLHAAGFRFGPTFIDPFQKPLAFGLSDSGEDGDDHFAHGSFGIDPVIQKTKGNAQSIELFD